MPRMIGFSAPCWVFEEIVENRPKGKNRSEWITELIVKGYKVLQQKSIYTLWLLKTYIRKSYFHSAYQGLYFVTHAK